MSHTIPMALLGQVTTLQAGVGFSPHLQGRHSGEFPFAKVGDISAAARTGKWLNSAKNYVNKNDLEELKTNPLPPGSILFAKIGEAIRQNFRVVTTCPCLIDNNSMGIIPDQRHVLGDYLFHFLCTLDFYQLADKTTVPSIRKSRLAQIPIPLPPLPSQRRIADVLDRAEALRVKRRAALAELDALLKSMFLDCFGELSRNPHGFPRKMLGELIDFEGGAQPPKEVFSSEPGPDKIRLIQIRDFKTDRFATYIPKNKARRFFEQDDVMIGRYGPPVFQILRGLSGSYNVALMKAVPREGVTKEFIYHLLQVQSLHCFVVDNSERTAGQSGINLGLLEQYPVYLPPLDIQYQFAERAVTVGRLQSTHRASLAELDSLFSSLQHRAFRGEL